MLQSSTIKTVRIVEKILERLSGHHLLLYRKNSDGDTALHIAARLGLEDIVRVLIESAKGDFCLKRLTRKVNRESDSALHDAARNGHLGVVRLLIQEDRKLALLTNSAGESPLFLALERNYFDITRELLDSTEKCSLAGRRGMNALHLAVIYLHEGMS
ncbi:Ankyrin repeat-containing protein [Morus notabilis]|uniref:Ankyrin repeat-containing protein n=1 Tax=Morus notabilis TaxID=981085 RepID=W9RSI6_9ROSA|nr:Ankyrin repeat-containing protein [Morus notabilis]